MTKYYFFTNYGDCFYEQEFETEEDAAEFCKEIEAEFYLPED